MKYLALLLAAGAALPAEQFVTGQAARAVIGQRTFTRQEPGASQVLVGSVSGLALANDTLFVVDGSRVQAFPQNNRVLIYRNVSTDLPGADASIPWDEARRCPLCGGASDTVLGQPDFEKTEIGTGARSFRTPTAVATDGRVLAVADTDNNRVLIWTSIPTSNGEPANVVIGQQDFNATAINAGNGSQVNERGLRGPQGVWIDQRGRLWVADTQNNRVLMWNEIPRANGAPATLVLGAPDMTTFVEVDLTRAQFNATATNLLNPVSVTVDPSDRVFVSDLGHNRVLVWNSLPTRNAQPADFALGQPDTSSTQDRPAQNANNSQFLCQSNGTAANGNPTYPELCEATLNFPRFALSDGKQLFVADGGNNRVLVYNTIPTRNGQPADIILGQPTATLNLDATGDPNSLARRLSSADSVRTPMALAWDGTNLYVSDPFNRRIMVWTTGDLPLP
ncbi:MAG TPA: NHL repeat-containing protein, partial [Bryobacteraceae bacterium]|nr:NHL repeat-containing protein [Bryobacteraceae bacterium]